MIKRLLLLSCLLSTLVFASPIRETGLIEGQLSYSLDTLNQSTGQLVHQERLIMGIDGSASYMDLAYKLTLGGALQGNTGFSKTRITPEYSIQTKFQPSQSLELALFSYSRLRNPMQMFSDSLEYREFVNGVKLAGRLSEQSNFSVSTGMRSQQINHRDSVKSSQQYVQIHLDQHLGDMQFRLSGETDIWGRDTLDQRHNTKTSLQWYGSPLKNLRWSASNSFYRLDDVNAWRFSHRLNYDLSKKQTLWANLSQGDFAYGSQTLVRSNYDLRYRFQWKPALGFDMMVKGNRVGVRDSIDIFHWRSYGVGSTWNAGRKGTLRGKLEAGFKESYNYGKGIDVFFSATEAKQFLKTRLVRIEIRDDLSTEFFQRIDETGDPRYDIRHKVRFSADLSPRGRFQLGNHFKIHTHLGSDLDFSPDTMRNALIDEIYLKSFTQKSQVSIKYRTVFEFRDPESDLQFYFNTRLYRKVTENLSYNLMSMYRFKSDIYQDYLWLTASMKFQAQLFSYAIEIQSAGPAKIALEQDSRISFRFVRRI